MPQLSIEPLDTSSREKSRGPAKLTGAKVWTWWREAVDASKDARKEADKNCRYYDNEQWTPDEKEELEDRGQAALVRNEIKPTLDLVIGTERKTRIDFTTAPRTAKDIQDSQIAKELLKYVGDQNHQKFLASEGFSQQVKAGWSWVEICENEDPTGEPVALRKVERSDFVWDPFAVEFDRQDGKYEIRGKTVDIEDAVAMFPKYKEKLETAVSETKEDGEELEQPYKGTEDQADRPGIRLWDSRPVGSEEWIDKSRKRIRLLECWYKVPTKTYLVVNDLTGDVDEFDPNLARDILFTPGTKIIKRSIRKCRVCIVAGNDVLEDNATPYRHNLFPFVPFWAYLTDKKHMPYGLITQLRDMQDEINKRHSKAMFLLNSRQIIADSDAIDQKQNTWDEVLDNTSRPNGKILLDGTKANRRFEFVPVSGEIRLQYEFQKDAQDAIRSISGVSGELRGEETNASSGRAVIARSVQGHTILGELFDNYRRSCQLIEEMKWAMIQQFYNKNKVFRVTDQTGQFSFLEINKYVSDGSRILIQNDITKAKVDIVFDEVPYHASVRQAMLEQMLEMVAKLPPDIGLLLLDLVVGYSDMPKSAEMVERIRQVQGIVQQKSENEQRLKDADAQVKLAKAAEGNGQGALGGSQSTGVETRANNPADSQAMIEAAMMGGM